MTTSRSKERHFKVRFSLEKKTYMKWIIKQGDSVEVYDPDKVSLLLEGCKLVNRESIAKRIHSGADKRVCAWIEAEAVTVLPSECGPCFEQIKYDPRHTPHWIDGETIVDGVEFSSLMTKGRRVYKSYAFF